MRAEIINIEARGQKWSGTYQVDGDQVSVSSAYGWDQATLGRREPKDVATKLLIDQVTRWSKRRG